MGALSRAPVPDVLAADSVDLRRSRSCTSPTARSICCTSTGATPTRRSPRTSRAGSRSSAIAASSCSTTSTSASGTSAPGGCGRSCGRRIRRSSSCTGTGSACSASAARSRRQSSGCSRRPRAREKRTRCARFFSRLGSAVGARYSVDALQDRLTAERAAHGAEVTALTSQLSAASAAIGRLEAHVRYEQEQSAALRQQGEHGAGCSRCRPRRRPGRGRGTPAARGRDRAGARPGPSCTISSPRPSTGGSCRAGARGGARRRRGYRRAAGASNRGAADRAREGEGARATGVDARERRRSCRGRSAARRPARRGTSLLRHPRRLREARAIARSGLFDEAYYLGRYPDVATSGMSPLAHFVLHGGLEGRAPHPLFDADYYLRRNPDVAARRVNPLAHYVRRGVLERRNPSPVFDVAFYLDSNPDVAARRHRAAQAFPALRRRRRTQSQPVLRLRVLPGADAGRRRRRGQPARALHERRMANRRTTVRGIRPGLLPGHLRGRRAAATRIRSRTSSSTAGRTAAPRPARCRRRPLSTLCRTCRARR